MRTTLAAVSINFKVHLRMVILINRLKTKGLNSASGINNNRGEFNPITK